MATSPGAPMRSPLMHTRSSIACAGCFRLRGRRPSASLHNEHRFRICYRVKNNGGRGDGHAADQEGRPELTLLRKLARAAFVARLGAAGALDVGGAEAEVQAGGVAGSRGGRGRRLLSLKGS